MATKKKIKKILKVSVKRPKSRAKAKPKSFKIVKESTPFVSFRITEQTIFWSILLVYVLLLSMWILKIQLDTLTIIDKINAL